MHAVDAVILLAFLAYAVWSGVANREAASRNLESYFLAGRALPGWQAGISMAATQFAADTPLLVTGLIATAGIFGLWRLWIYGVAFLMVGFLLAPSWRRAGVLTDAELTEVRYGPGPARFLRLFKAVYFGTVFNCTVLAMVLLAAARILEPFFPWHNAISLGILLVVVVFYSTTGGLRSVVRTDVVQFALAMGGTLLYAFYVVAECGGLGGLHDRVTALAASSDAIRLTPTQLLAFVPSQAKDAGLAVLALFALQWLVQINADGTGYIAQRIMACRSDRDAVQASVIFAFSQILLRSLIWLPIGLGLLVLFPPAAGAPLGDLFAAEREGTFVRGIAELLPAGVRGLLLTSLFAALASTVDTHLNWGASYWTNDIIKPFVAPRLLGRPAGDRELVWTARASNLLIVAVALAVMTRLSSIQAAWQTSLLLGAGVGVMLVLRWLWWRLNVWGEIAAVVASLVLAPVLLFAFPPEKEALRLLVMAAGATAAGVAASLLTAPAPMDRLAEFYRRARPPGFWGPVARHAGDGPGAARRRLSRGALATAATSFSLFALLTGFGAWLVGSPAPAWCPSRVVWIGSLLVAGTALLPVGWKLGTEPRVRPETAR